MKKQTIILLFFAVLLVPFCTKGQDAISLLEKSSSFLKDSNYVASIVLTQVDERGDSTSMILKVENRTEIKICEVQSVYFVFIDSLVYLIDEKSSVIEESKLTEDKKFLPEFNLADTSMLADFSRAKLITSDESVMFFKSVRKNYVLDVLFDTSTSLLKEMKVQQGKAQLLIRWSFSHKGFVADMNQYFDVNNGIYTLKANIDGFKIYKVN